MMQSMERKSKRIPQLPDGLRPGYDAIFNSNILLDIPKQLEAWSSKRVLLVVSKSLEKNTDCIARLETALGAKLVDKKSGVGSHSPYAGNSASLNTSMLSTS
jgi:hypothetical protein